MTVTRVAITSVIALAGAMLAACQTAPSAPADPQTLSWRKVTQGNDYSAVFVNEPGTPREGRFVTFRLRFVYLPGRMKHDGKDVAWQEYHAMTVDCADNKVRVGPRSRHAPDGAVIAEDDDQTFNDILWGMPADDAARAKCREKFWVGDVSFANTPGWMDEARAHIAAAKLPVRPSDW